MPPKTLGQFKSTTPSSQARTSTTPASLSEFKSGQPAEDALEPVDVRTVEVPVDVYRDVIAEEGLVGRHEGKSLRLSLEPDLKANLEAAGSIGQLHSNSLSAIVSLTDANATLTVSGGRRYIIPAATLSVTRRTLTLSNTDAEVNDTITIDRRDSSAWQIQVVNAAGLMLTMIARRGLYRFRFDGAAWQFEDHDGRFRVFKVMDYGARGDEYYSSTSTTIERNAIQAAIDAAAVWCRTASGSGAVVDFGSGTYRIDGELIMRRTPRERPIIYRGDGAMIMDQSVVPDHDLFRVETIAESQATDPVNYLSWGGYGHQWEGLYFNGGARCFSWDLGFPGDYGFADGVRLQGHFWRCYFDHNGTGPAVRLSHSTRTTFFECDVDPGFYEQGNTWVECVMGSVNFIRCQGGGAFLRGRNTGEIYLYACRPEGGLLTPAIDLYDVGQLTIHGGSTEGHDEGPSLIRIVKGRWITIDNFGLANIDRSFVRCRGTVTFSGIPVAFENKNNSPYTPSTFPSCRRTDGGSWYATGVAYGSKVRFTGAPGNTGALTVIEMTHDTLYFDHLAGETITPEAVTVGGTASVYHVSLPNAPQIVFATGGSNTITRNARGPIPAGSWIDDGFVTGMKIRRTNALNNANKGIDVPGGTQLLTITNVTDTVLTVTEVLVNETVTLGDVMADHLGAGIQLIDCEHFDVNVWAVSAFSSAGNQGYNGIEVDANCSNGRIIYSSGALVSLGQTDVSIHPSAYNVTGEYTGVDGSGNPVMKPFGTHRFAAVDNESSLSRLRVGQAAAPSTLAGLSVAVGTGNGFTGIWYDPTVGSAGWKASASTDEATLSTLANFYAANFVGDAAQGTHIVALSGKTINLDFTNATLGDTNGFYFERVDTSYMRFAVSGNLYFSPVSGWIQFEPTEFVQFNIANNKYFGVVVNGQFRLRCDATGIGVFGVTPAAQQTDMGALTDSSGGTADGTVAAVSGSGADATINDNFADLTAKINTLRNILRTFGYMA